MLSPTGADGAVAALFPVRKTQYAVAYARLCELRRFLIYPSASAFIAGDQIIVIAAPILAPFRNRPALMMKQQKCIVVPTGEQGVLLPTRAARPSCDHTGKSFDFSPRDQRATDLNSHWREPLAV